MQASYYFNKIQCFCFEDQILNPGEQVGLPVFFYIDPDYVIDPDLEYTDSLILSYAFFESKSGTFYSFIFPYKCHVNVSRVLYKSASFF